jgi:hypothetical protein
LSEYIRVWLILVFFLRAVCIKGLLTGIDAVFGLVNRLLTSGVQDYICMYRFSQDHLELFFNAVRQSGEYKTFYCMKFCCVVG